MPQTKIRIGIISFAHGHVQRYIQEIANFDDAEVVAAWDADEQRGQENAAKYQLQWESNLATLLARSDIDAVFVTSPTNKHAEHCVAAAHAGKHILLQKPMALSLADCDTIIQAVQTNGVKFSMCHQMRADPVNQKIKQLLHEKQVGDIAVVKRRHAINVLLNPDFTRPDNWHIDPLQNMGMFMDDASHATDWLHWMLGRPVSVMAEIDNVVTHVAPDDNGVAIYRFSTGIIGILLNSSTQLAAQSTTEIYGTQGTILQDYGDAPSSHLPAREAPLRIYQAGQPQWETFDFPFVPHHTRISAVPRPLIDYLKGEREPLATAADGRVAVEMVLGAYQSAKTGQRVHFPLPS
jgi:predicted dehydrogenase